MSTQAIGIVSIPIPKGKNLGERYEQMAQKGKSYLAASYVKYYEMYGFRVVPIQYSISTRKLDHTLKNISAAVFPGGTVTKLTKAQYDKYSKTLSHIHEHASKMNKEGVHFPLLGVCLGMEMLLIIHAKMKNTFLNYMNNKNLDCLTSWDRHMDPFDQSDSQKITEKVKKLKKSSLFSGIEAPLLKKALKEDSVFFNHGHTFLFNKRNIALLSPYFRIISNSTSPSKQKFIGALEAKKFPFYAVQFHPEKTIFEWEVEEISHNQTAIDFSHYIARFFSLEVKKNSTEFNDTSLCISNFTLEPNTLSNKIFEEIYYF